MANVHRRVRSVPALLNIDLQGASLRANTALGALRDDPQVLGELCLCFIATTECEQCTCTDLERFVVDPDQLLDLDQRFVRTIERDQRSHTSEAGCGRRDPRVDLERIDGAIVAAQELREQHLRDVSSSVCGPAQQLDRIDDAAGDEDIAQLGEMRW